MDDRGNVFFVEEATSGGTPLKLQDAYATARRLRRSGLSPSGTLPRSPHGHQSEQRRASAPAVTGTVHIGREKRRWSVKRLPKAMLKGLTGQRRTHADLPEVADRSSVGSSERAEMLIPEGSSRPKSLSESSGVHVFDVRLCLPASGPDVTFSALGIAPGRRRPSTASSSPLVAAAARRKMTADANAERFGHGQEIVVRNVMPDTPAAQNGEIQQGEHISTEKRLPLHMHYAITCTNKHARTHACQHAITGNCQSSR